MSLEEDFREGVLCHRSGELSEATRFYKLVLEKQPNHPHANHNMGLVVATKGEFDLALSFINQAIEIDPLIGQFWKSKIKVLINTKKYSEIHKILYKVSELGLWDSSFQEFSDFISSKLSSDIQKKTNTNNLFQKQLNDLIKLYEIGKFGRVIEEAEKILEIFPNSAEIMCIIGASHKAKKNLNSALECFKKALKISPLDAAIHNNIGTVLAEQEKLNESLFAYKNAISIKSDFAEAYYNMGNTLAKLEKNLEAEEAFNKAISIKPDYVGAYLNLGNLFNKCSRFLNAEEAFKKAISIKPDYVDAYLNLSNVCHSLRKLEDAIAFNCRALSLDPKSVQAKRNIVELLKRHEPVANYNNEIVSIDKKLKEKFKSYNFKKKDTKLANDISQVLDDVYNLDTELKTNFSQIYNKNSENLNCKRHHKIFNEVEIIPEFCFECYKVQVEVKTVIDLIRLVFCFYDKGFAVNLTKKCLIELRSNIKGAYKGLVYCRGSNQAQKIIKQLECKLSTLGIDATVRIKRGCSEFPLKFPEYESHLNEEIEPMLYPTHWKKKEIQFDKKNEKQVKDFVLPSLKSLCLSDILIIHMWLDYARGLSDPTSKIFEDRPLKYNDIYQIAKNRSEQSV